MTLFSAQTERAEPGSFRFIELAGGLIVAAIIGLLVIRIGGWAAAMLHTVAYPNQIDYGEGIIWQQADLILRGEGYKDIRLPPHIVFHYPPVFHVASGLIARLTGADQLLAGRAVSVFSTLGILLIVATLVFQAASFESRRLLRIIPAALAGLIGLSFYPIVFWGLTDRVDMLAIFLSLAGVSYALRAATAGRFVWVAALLFALSMLTKQTMVAAPAAAFLVLLLVRPRMAWLDAAATAALGMAAVLILQVMTDGGFLKHIVGFNINRLSLSNVWTLIVQFQLHFAVVLLAYFGGFALARDLFRHKMIRTGFSALKRNVMESRSKQIELFAVCYLALGTLTTGAILKSGASFNYLLEWMVACSLVVGLLLRRPILIAFSSLANRAGRLPHMGPQNAAVAASPANAAWIFVPVLLFAQFAGLPAPHSLARLSASEDTAQFEELVELVRHAGRPVISDNMVVIMKAGKQLFLEPAIIAELTALGTWDETPFLDQIRRHYLAFFVIEDSSGGRLKEARYSPAVREAIAKHYPRTEKLAGHTIHFPNK